MGWGEEVGLFGVKEVESTVHLVWGRGLEIASKSIRDLCFGQVLGKLYDRNQEK